MWTAGRDGTILGGMGGGGDVSRGGSGGVLRGLGGRGGGLPAGSEVGMMTMVLTGSSLRLSPVSLGLDW